MVRRLLALVLLAALGAPLGAAQDADRLRAATAAYAEGDFATATRLLRAAVDAAPDDAEAHYALGRVLSDPRNPNVDDAAGRREIGRAADLQPDNVLYLVAELEALRRDTWNFFEERLLAIKRADLARRILTLDPENGFAHEELGVASIRDYYRYRNAVRLPGLSANSYYGGADDFQQNSIGLTDAELSGAAATGVGTDGTVSEIPQNSTAGVFDGPTGASANRGDVGGNRFDVASLQAQGEIVVTFEARADRALAEATDHLARALRDDPRRRSVYDHVVRLATIADDFPSVLPAVEQMYVYFPEDAGMWLYLGLVNHRLGNWEGAEVAFRNGLGRLDAPARETFTDLTLLLPPNEWAAYRADPEPYAERYWTSRDPRFLNTVNERRSEHYARLVTAELLFRADDVGIPGWKTERGELYVRYGQPRTDVVIDGGPAGGGSFEGVVEAFPNRAPGFKTGPGTVGNRFNVWDYGDLFFVFEDPARTGEFRLYSPPADLFAVSTSAAVDRFDYVLEAREAIRRTPERYTFKAPGRPIELPYRVAAFKGQDGQADLYLGFGIPVASVDGDVGLTVSTAAALIGPTREVLAERRRTIYGLRAAQIVAFDSTRLWTGVERLRSGPGAHEVQLEFETAAGAVSASQRKTVVVPDFSAPGLQLSDILLAYYVEEAEGAEPGRVTRDGLSMQAAPWGVYAVDDPIHVYFEVYGLGLTGGRSDFEVEARLVPKDTSTGLGRIARRIFGGRAQGVSTAAEAQGSRPDDAQSLILDASGQAPGFYTLTVVVRDRVSGASADRETDLLLE